MHGSLYVNPTQAPPSPRRRSFVRMALALGVLGAAVLAIVAWILHAPGAPLGRARAEQAPGPTWKASQIYTPVSEHSTPPVAPPAPAPTDDAKWRQQEIFNQMLLDRLKQRSTAQASAPAATPVLQRKPPAAPIKYAAPLFLENKLSDTPVVAAVPTYLLGVGSYLPCQIETAINSDVEGYFVATVSQVVWDTETGLHALVPPGSKILGTTQSNKLVFGSERLDTVSLKLRLPTGRDVDLKTAPVTDGAGTSGLTGEINRHLGRIYGAVFLTGVLKGGTAAMQSALSQANGANQVAVSVAGGGSQATSHLAGPLIDTRPTIKVAAGQSCQVILLQSLELPAVWHSGEPGQPTGAITARTKGEQR